VPAAQEIIKTQLDDPAVANSPLVFPDAAMDQKARGYYVFQGTQDLDEWNSIFEPIIQS
jgi:spermidine/putrescine transport system substrate-binding protein